MFKMSAISCKFKPWADPLEGRQVVPPNAADQRHRKVAQLLRKQKV
jgi:hypothetical protein